MRPGTAVGPGANSAIAALTVVALAGLLAAGPASAASAWLPAASLGGSDISAESPSIAVAANGDAAGVMYVQPRSGANGIQALTHQIGGSWQQTMLTTASPVGSAQVTIDASGDASVAWQSNDTIDVATAPGDGAWSTPVQVDPGASAVTDPPRMAEDATGDISVVYDTLLAPQSYAIWWTERPAGGSWSTPKVIGGADADPGPQLTSDAAGDLVAWWLTQNNGLEALAANVRPAGGNWETTPQYVSPSSGPMYQPNIAFGPGGVVHAIWALGYASVAAALDSSDFTPGGPDGGSWSAPTQVTVAGSSAEYPAIGFDAAGDETLLWTPVDNANGGTWGVDAATRPSAGSWSAPTTLVAIGDAVGQTPALSVSPAGQSVAGYAVVTGTPPTTELSLRPVGGTWQPAIELSPYDSGSFFAPSLGQDDAGNVLAAWQENLGQIQSWAEAYDASGPVMTNLSIPATGTVGLPVTFAVTPLGAWSPVVSTQWSFGDGTGEIDQTVSHTYTQPGKYTVTASAGDSQGNSSASSGTITISAPPPATGGSAPVSPAGAFVAALPSLSRVSQSHARWRDGKAVAKAARARHPKRPPVGTKLSFSVSATAQVKFSFTQVLAGRLVKHRCVAPTSANDHARSCKRTETRGTLSYSFSAGPHHLSFDGRIGRRRLGAGSYTVAVSASNAAGHSAVKTLHFKIVG